MVEYFNHFRNKTYYYAYNDRPVFVGGVLMLDPRETFDKYERRSPQPPQITERREYIACEYRREPQSYPDHGQLVCEYRAAPPHSINRDARMACEYRRDPHDPGMLACELRGQPQPRNSTTVTTFVPETNKRKLPVGLIIAVAICIPVFIVIVLFAAVWLQELGIL